jgi:glycosyltransferase involved in cell wall biosynthesis
VLSIDITIYITSYNRPKYLLEAVKSIEIQGVPADRIIVLDNCSDVLGMPVVKDKLQGRVKWVGSQENRGTWWNFERAFIDNKSEFMMVMHDDDRLIADFLDEQSNILSSNPSISAVSCNGFKINSIGDRFSGYLIADTNTEKRKYFCNSAQVGLHTFNDSCIPPSPMVYRSSVVKNLVMKLKKYRKYFDQTTDVALNMFIADAGILVLNMKPLYECRIHDTQDSSGMLKDNEKYLRDYSINKLSGSGIELRAVRKAVKSNYTYGVIYGMIKSINNLDFNKSIEIIKNLDYSHLSVGGCLRIIKILYRKFKLNIIHNSDLVINS